MTRHAERRAAIKHAAKSCGVLAVCVVLLAWAGLTLAQAVLLAIGFEVLRQSVIALQRQAAFEPFELSLQPNWFVLAEQVRARAGSHDGPFVEWFRSHLAPTRAALRIFEEGVRITFLERGKCYIHQLDTFATSATFGTLLLAVPEAAEGLARLEARYAGDEYEFVLVLRSSGASTPDVQGDTVHIGALPISLIRFLFWEVGTYEEICRELSRQGWSIRNPDAVFDQPFSLHSDRAVVRIRFI